MRPDADKTPPPAPPRSGEGSQTILPSPLRGGAGGGVTANHHGVVVPLWVASVDGGPDAVWNAITWRNVLGVSLPRNRKLKVISSAMGGPCGVTPSGPGVEPSQVSCQVVPS